MHEGEKDALPEWGYFCQGGRRREKNTTTPHPPALPNKQVWEIIVNVKGIKKASVCVCVRVLPG